MPQLRATRGGGVADAEGFTLVQRRANRQRSASPRHTTVQRERSPPRQTTKTKPDETKPTEGQVRAATNYLNFIQRIFPQMRVHAQQMLDMLPRSDDTPTLSSPSSPAEPQKPTNQNR
jgi:hypothetical protein